MSDISKCDNAACPKAATCYRFTAPANPHRQSYISPSFDENGCDNYWSTEPKETEYVLYAKQRDELFIVKSTEFFNTKTLPEVTVYVGIGNSSSVFLADCVVVGIL